MSINVTQREFGPREWYQMVIDAANSRKEGETPKNICKVIYPHSICTLELKTAEQVKQHFKLHGYWDSNCGKMTCKDVINITRICSSFHPVALELKEPLKQALGLMASRAEEKYGRGFMGCVRKVFVVFFNFFTTNSVCLFRMPGTTVFVERPQTCKKNELPFFIGNSAKFARLVEGQLS